MNAEPELRPLELAVCAQDVAHWVSAWCWTYDPRHRPSTLPFDLFPRQAELLDWLAERERLGEDGLVEKSRDSGLTWLCAAYALHAWLFRPGAAIGFGSRKLDLVDRKGDPDCIFEKLRFLLASLPRWMLPRAFDPLKHDGHCKLVNPDTGASVTGEGGDNIGRGGRKTLYVIDEAAFIERPEMVERSLAQTTTCRIDVSTPNGPGNPFARRRFSGTVPVFTFHWRDDPRKGEEWYAAQKRKLDPVTLAQEVDIDYTASVEGITIPAAWVRAAVRLALPESGPVCAALDVADTGRNLNVFLCRRGPVARWPEHWSGLNTTQTAFRARDLAEQAHAGVLHYDCVGVGAGVRGALDSAHGPLRFRPHAVNTGESPTLDRWPDGKTSKERFVNLRAELWWKVRCRFERAYEFREKGIRHPPEEMISIPDHPQLIAELSLPLHFHTDTGKIKLESKEDMARRGVKSPDFADALVLCFAPEPPAYYAPRAGGTPVRPAPLPAAPHQPFPGGFPR